MERSIVETVNDALENIDKESNRKEEAFIYLIRTAVLKKSGIRLSIYMEFLEKNLGSINERSKEDICLEEIAKQQIDNLDLNSLCGVLEDHMNNQKRELTGSYYTPGFVIEYIFTNSIILFLRQNTTINKSALEKLIKDETISDINSSELIELLEKLNKLKVIDIACGTGLFLHHSFEKLLSIKKLIYKELDMEINEYYERKFILENNIFGIDIQLAPLEMIALKYIDMLASYREFSLDSIKINFYQRNTILGNEIFTASKINEVIEKGGFDIVIGNPPYVGEKGNKSLFENIRKHEFGKKYYEAKMDYFYYFIYRGIDMLKETGVLSYITTNYFITADGAKKLRKFFKENVSFRDIVNFNEYEIFKAAKGQHNMIFTLTKGNEENRNINVSYIKNYKLETNEIAMSINNKKVNNQNISSYVLDKQRDLYAINGNIMTFPDKKYAEIIKKIKYLCSQSLGDICNINQGIVSGADKVSKRMLETKFKQDTLGKYNIDIDEGIFVLNKEEIIDSYAQGCQLLKPFYKNSDIKKYFTSNTTDKYILYFTDKNIINSDKCDVIQNRLLRYKDVLDLRRETQKGTRKWFALQWSREQRIFDGPKIVVPHRAVRNKFGYNEDMWYASADVYYITTKNENIDLKLLLGILNSKITYFWLYNMGKRKGNYLELYSSPLGQIPITIDIQHDVRERIINTTDKILSICKNEYDHKLVEEYQDRIDRELFKVYSFTKEEIKAINELYPKKH